MPRAALPLALLALLACDPPKPIDATPDTASDTASDTACGGDLTLVEGQVRSTQGVLQGHSSGSTWAFLGLPFAQPPVGPLRFRPPEPPTCSDEVFDAADYAPLCVQRDEDGVISGEEDCLALNIWTPSTALSTAPATASLPVLFFIHGGGNVMGGTSVEASGLAIYDGAQLAERTSAVVVTASYRLGALGFLAHPALSAEAGTSGNYGLRDQLMALQWVHDQIEAFGGDPSRVLVFGESAGAVNTCALLTSPAAEGLMSAAAMESGACTQPTLAEREAEGEDKIALTDCAGTEDVAACLRALDADTLAALSDDVVGSYGVPGGGGFGPNVDGDLLPMDPMEALEAGARLAVPLIIGTNADETAMWVPTMTEEQYNSTIESLFGRLADRVLEVYPLSAYDSPRWAWIALTTDAAFTCPARTFAAAAAQTAPVYRYWFTKDPEGASGIAYGSFHGLELTYVFQHLDAISETTGYAPSDADFAVEAAMGAAWGALAADGAPGADLGWPAYDPETDPYLEFGSELRAGEGVRTEQCDLWDALSVYALL